MNFKHLGIAIGCSQYDISAEDLPYISGIVKQSSSDDSQTKLLAKSVASFLDTFNGAGTAPANHLHMISKQASLTPELKETVHDAVLFIKQASDTPLIKSAGLKEGIGKLFNMLSAGSNSAQTLFTTALLLSAAGGVGAGGLKWVADRQMTQDEDETEKLDAQIDYYNHIADKLDSKMRKKYNYNVEDYEQ